MSLASPCLAQLASEPEQTGLVPCTLSRVISGHLCSGSRVALLLLQYPHSAGAILVALFDMDDLL